MKKAVFIFFTLINFLLIESCTIETNECSGKMTCQNGATCLDGLCVCAAGYEGQVCENTLATRYAGVFAGHLTQVCNGTCPPKAEDTEIRFSATANPAKMTARLNTNTLFEIQFSNSSTSEFVFGQKITLDTLQNVYLQGNGRLKGDSLFLKATFNYPTGEIWTLQNAVLRRY